MYYIQNISSNLNIGLASNKELIFDDEKNNLTFWNFTQIRSDRFLIKNIDNCYLKMNKSGVFCEKIQPSKASQLKVIKIFSEVDEIKNTSDFEKINKEPIDIVIKYIDLMDPNLKREGIPQIKKDYDNEELRYSVRSILKNIPWVRKIFIVMPNEKVRYFKEYKLIKEKIIFIKDKDVIGHDSSNPRAFQFRYWKLKKFNISENIIVMDDDYFIGNELKKTDFFHVNNGKVVPNIVTSDFLKINKRLIKEERKYFKLRTKLNKEEQTGDVFDYCRFSTYLFVINLFYNDSNENIFIPRFTHNAIPVHLKDIKETYKIIYKSNYKYATLDCKYRNMEGLQFEIFILLYTFIKYNRKIKNISHNFIKLNDSIYGNYQTSLFCINRGAGEVSLKALYQERIIMEHLFPIPSPYELVDKSKFNLESNFLYSIDKGIKSNAYLNILYRKKNYFNILLYFNLIS